MIATQVQGRQLHKFGGSSLADSDAYLRAVRILRQYASADDLVVVSAAGETTNLLWDWLEQLQQDGRVAHERLMALRQYQQQLIERTLPASQAASLLQNLHHDFSELATFTGESLSAAMRANALGFGELWSARLLTARLNSESIPAQALDSRLFLRAQADSAQPEVNAQLSLPLLQQCLAENAAQGKQLQVITGFMAQNEAQETVLLGRNGSDYSATVIGALADVLRVTIWSDVAGVYSADPHVVDDACLLPLLRLDEASELARLASPVLHTRTLQPVAQSALDLMLRCSYEPELGSTHIERVLASGRGAKIITALDDVYLLTVELTKAKQTHSVSERLFAQLAQKQLQPLAYDINPELGTIALAYTSEVVGSVLSLLDQQGLGELNLKDGYSLIAAVGAGVVNNPMHCYGFYQQLADQSVEFIAAADSKLSLAAVVRCQDSGNIVRGIHQRLFKAQKRIGLVVCGNGNIGSRWLSLFAEQQASLVTRHEMQFDLLAVVETDRAWVNLQGIDASLISKEFTQQAQPYDATLFSSFAQSGCDEVVIVDLTASERLARQYQQFAELGYHLICANKIAGSSTTASYQAVCHAFAKTGRHWLYNATVGAGLPINHTVRDLRDSGDQLLSLSGIFSGTLSWLFLQFDGSIPFSQLVDLAWQQGLTEPDPRHDLDGSDVMRKLVILAREAGLAIEPEQVKVESLVPDSLAEVSLDCFFESVDELDTLMSERLARAQRQGKVLRYVARLDKDGRASVGVEAIAENHPLAMMLPCDNIFAIESQWYRDNPLVIRGPGAGRDVTAGAIQSDLNRLATLLSH